MRWGRRYIGERESVRLEAWYVGMCVMYVIMYVMMVRVRSARMGCITIWAFG